MAAESGTRDGRAVSLDGGRAAFNARAPARDAFARARRRWKVRIPKRRGPPLATPIRLAIGRTLPAASSITDIRSHALAAVG
jgi:hypothetical protein